MQNLKQTQITSDTQMKTAQTWQLIYVLFLFKLENREEGEYPGVKDNSYPKVPVAFQKRMYCCPVFPPCCFGKWMASNR